MKRSVLAIACASVLLAGAAVGSSHREAPNITKFPKVDGTDLYMFRSYETGREAFVTILANYQPFQDPEGGPNFYLLDAKARYDINIDNNGDAQADLIFRINPRNFYRDIQIPVGGRNVSVPLSNIGAFNHSSSPVLNVLEGYTVQTIRGGNAPVTATNDLTGAFYFVKPFDNIGQKSIPTYAAYSERYIASMSFQGCASSARVFVSQRKESFQASLGEIFDLINLNPLGAPDAEANDLEDKNITTIALEVPISCLTNGAETVIGAWTTASLPNEVGVYEQGSRLGMPLVNEVVIGLNDKNDFNASNPTDDGQFYEYVAYPTLPELIEALFGVQAPNRFPRNDLVPLFLTGLQGLNKPANAVASEMLRLNTAIAPKTASNQSSLGVLGGDTAGYPNGRRPGDDVVDISLRVLMGALLPASDAPSGSLPYTDGVATSATEYRNTFPYLNTPIPGATL